ncbi:peroxisomal (S)-2-hydroxy-acid oxidase [Paecilomyces variotii No. 5]|uniref:Peroxisomal (S)-2-hydroxy-acid oxidase n=1 Tax=Byssochlamys spectabilis (strain No. 5 / NBRC 109023) TaxID=1356009 RepID=V5G1X5_BYSSN|nr:peroxisomal (S)-2-hydroxy-acid oxidase [Paecilomyces variotii No. 5]
MAADKKHTKQGSQTPEAKDDPITIAELFSLAQRKLPKRIWDYYASGSDEGYAVRRNNKAYDKLFIRPRVLRNVATIDTSTSLFGYRYPFPVGIAPTAMQKLVGGHGELDMARAAAKIGTGMILSTQSTTSLEDVIEAPPGGRPENFWFQIYVSVDREKSASLVRRAEAAGYKAIVLTVDTPILGNRINERKTPLTLPEHLHLANIEDPNNKPKVPKPTVNRLFMDARTAEEAYKLSQQAPSPTMNDASLTWPEAMDWLRSQTSLKIILKGIMTAEDALLAIEHGADGIVVSNHGGRQLDSVSSTIETLPEVVAAVRGRVPVILDGGIRRGSDVFKALALGADFTLIGRPSLWGLSHSGQDGVETVLNILERELSRTMTLAGAKKVSDIRSGMLGVEKRDGFGISRL